MVNDNYGHIVGDRVLKYVADTVSGSMLKNTSFGITDYTPEIKDDLELIHNADVAMYRSKEKGRNRVTLY